MSALDNGTIKNYVSLTQVEPSRERNQAATITSAYPDRAAIICISPLNGLPEAQAVTYHELISRVERRAAALATILATTENGSSTPRGIHVGLLGRNSTQWLIDFYALQLIGAVPVPLSYKYPTAALTHVLSDAGIELVLIDEQARRQVDDLPSEVRSRLTIEKIGAQAPTAGESCTVLEVPYLERPTPHDLAMILYTSGSTGNPKGVALNHASHVWVLDTVRTERATEYKVEVAAPLYHMNALARSQKALASGETIVLLTDFDAQTYVDAIGAFSINELTGVPPMFALLEPILNNYSGDLSSVKHVNMASAPAGDALFDAMGQAFSSARVTIGYGTTESGPVAFYPPEDVDVPVGSVGYPHPDVQYRLVDPATGDINESFGVLQIKTGAIFNGYLNKPLSDRPVTEDGFYHTKDLFRVENGFYFFAGREDDMFNSGAENVYPASVEAVLLAHPAIKEAVVVPIPDAVKTWKPVAFVTLTDSVTSGEEATPAERDLKAHTLEHLEPYAHPRRVWILDEMPLAGTNKIDRKALAVEAEKRVTGK